MLPVVNFDFIAVFARKKKKKLSFLSNGPYVITAEVIFILMYVFSWFLYVQLDYVIYNMKCLSVTHDIYTCCVPLIY